MQENAQYQTASQKRAERRKFIKKAGKVALTAPAVALLLSAESKHAQAAISGRVGGLTPDFKTMA